MANVFSLVVRSQVEPFLSTKITSKPNQAKGLQSQNTELYFAVKSLHATSNLPGTGSQSHGSVSCDWHFRLRGTPRP